ncbi:MAG: GNAT family N-acetyltransferase [Acidobacteriota bacterium]
MTVATTERLHLRRITPDDAPWALRLLNEPSFIANIADRGVRTVAEAARYLEAGPIASYAKHGYGMYVVELQATGEPLGMCGLVRRKSLDQADLGYAFFPAHWGRGYAREAAAASVEIASGLDLPYLLAIVNSDNEPSIRLLEALGFRAESQIRLEPEAELIELYRLDLPSETT